MDEIKRCYSDDKIQTNFQKNISISLEKNNKLSIISSGNLAGTTLGCK